MSSTNRGAVRDASDFYVTPIPAVELFLREWAKDEPGLKTVVSVLDPCAGGTMRDGKIVVPMSYPEAIHACPGLFHPSATLTTFDIRGDSLASTVGDWLARAPSSLRPNLVITNPPFSLAPQFISKGLGEVAQGGFVVMLLRLNFYGSKERRAQFLCDPPLGFGMPVFCYVHSERMKFNLHRLDLPPEKRRATDSIEYAHFVWQKGNTPKFTKLRII